MWLAIYSFLTLVCTNDVRNYKVDSVYGTFTRNQGLLKTLKSVLWIPMPILFCICHFGFYFVTHLVAVVMWHSYWLNMLMAIFLMEYSVMQGAHYYMDYFAKRYENQLAKLNQLEETVAQTPTLKRRISLKKSSESN